MDQKPRNGFISAGAALGTAGGLFAFIGLVLLIYIIGISVYGLVRDEATKSMLLTYGLVPNAPAAAGTEARRDGRRKKPATLLSVREPMLRPPSASGAPARQPAPAPPPVYVAPQYITPQYVTPQYRSSPESVRTPVDRWAEMRGGIGSEGEGTGALRGRIAPSAPARLWGRWPGDGRGGQHAGPVDPADRPGALLPPRGLRHLGARDP